MKNMVSSFFSVHSGMTAATLSLAACSGAPVASDDLPPEIPDLANLREQNQARIEEMTALAAEVPMSADMAALNEWRDNRELRFQERLAMSLTDAELFALQTRFGEDFRHQGRLIMLEGDVLVDVDDLLSSEELSGDVASLEVAEKGRVISQRITIGNPEAIAPTIYARQVDDQFFFNRPATDLHFVVVPDRPAFVFDLLLEATATILADRRDSLRNDMYTVIRQSDYDDLDGRARALSGFIGVVVGPVGTACPGGGATTFACNIFPRSESRGNGLGFSRPVSVIGDRMGIVSSNVTSNSAFNRGVIMHELMHGLGVAHLEDETFGTGADVLKLAVPGTATALATPSLMHRFTSDANWTQTPSADDRDVLRTLYPLLSGSGGDRGFELVQAR